MRPTKADQTECQPEAAAAIFPLPLTPFEAYYLADDAREYPTTFPLALLFSGRLDRACFETALEATLARHPMLRAVIDDSGPRPLWVAQKCGAAAVDWADASAPIAPPGGEFIDLRAAAGFRAWVRASEGQARVLLQFHHACCDGLAALQFVQDFLAAYKMAAGEPAELGEPDAALLKDRGRVAGKRPIWAVLRDVSMTVWIWARILCRAPQPLAVSGDGVPRADRKQEFLAFETVTFTREESAELRKLAGKLKATTNDLMLRDFLLALDAWNRDHGLRAARLRINVPASVRSRQDARLPAANRIGFGFIDATPRGADPARLLDVVRRQTRRIKEWKLGLYFLGGLALAVQMPALLRWSLERDRSFATAVLSNVGRFVPERSLKRHERWKCGQLVLESIRGVPPLRKLTRAAAIVAEYGGETSVFLRCDPRSFDAAQTRALLDAFAARVRQTLRRGK